MDYTLPLQNALTYIEENITSDVTLENLAAISGYSGFHFHKIFRSVLGESVMEFVRRKKVLYAAGDIAGTASTITDIALKYGFGSHDVFTHAFKRYLGVTPSRYRKINYHADSVCCSSQNTRGDSEMFHYAIYERMNCSVEEKRRCIPLIEFLLKLSEKARKNGLLSLENAAESQMFFFRKTLELVLDGVEPGYIKATMTNYLLAGDYKGLDLLERLLALEGVLAIQAGEHPSLLYEKLLSYLGEEVSQEAGPLLLHSCRQRKQSPEDFWEKIRTKKPAAPSAALLEDPVKKLDDRSLQRLLRDTGVEDIASALKGVGGETMIRILECIPKKTREIIIRELDGGNPVDPKTSIDAQNKILSLALRLRAEGEIK